ncbi:MAG: amidohydrolase family protein [Alphaproteobacteria bacterium]|nr:amidohydrolase family protein [Alphaproteobacteria bacterium]
MQIKILKGNIVHAPKFGDLSILENGYIVLEDGKIKGLFQNLPEEYKKHEIEDYTDKLILQSFCDMHLHAPQYPMLGMGMDLPLLEWLNTYTFNNEAHFADEDFARETYTKLANEMISNGTTRCCAFSSLHLKATNILMDIFEKTGMTGYVGKVNMDRNSGDVLKETTEQSKKDTITWLDETSSKYEHIKPILTPRFTPSCTNELMEFLGKLAKERNLPIQSHLSENTSEVAWVRELHPDCKQYWESYDKYGLFNDKTIMAHCVHCDQRERDAMKSRGVWVAHCPDSNVNLISGTAPVRVMMNEGIKVTLGSDIAGGDQLAMYKVICSAIKASKVKRIETNWTTDFLTVAEAYYLGTTAGAKFFGAGDGFAVGDELHAIVVDDKDFPKPVRKLSVKESFERTLYLMKTSNIVSVYSAGRKVK